MHTWNTFSQCQFQAKRLSSPIHSVQDSVEPAELKFLSSEHCRFAMINFKIPDKQRTQRAWHLALSEILTLAFTHTHRERERERKRERIKQQSKHVLVWNKFKSKFSLYKRAFSKPGSLMWFLVLYIYTEREREREREREQSCLPIKFCISCLFGWLNFKLMK